MTTETLTCCSANPREDHLEMDYSFRLAWITKAECSIGLHEDEHRLSFTEYDHAPGIFCIPQVLKDIKPNVTCQKRKTGVG